MNSKILTLIALFMIFTSCSDDETSPVDLLSQAERGALINAVEFQNNGILGGTLEGSLEVLLEYTDDEQGNLLDEMNVYTQFIDQSEDDDNTDVITTEVLLRTVDSETFLTGINNLPTHQLNITAEEFLNITNNTIETIEVGDSFTTRLELVLTDGRIFSFFESDQFDAAVATFLISTDVE